MSGKRYKEPSPRQYNYMLALLSEPTIEKAHKKAKIAEVTAYRWMKDPNFNYHFKKLRNEFIKNTTAKLQANSLRAVDTLVSIMENEDLSALARVQSAKTILEFAYKGTEIEEIQERLERLEEIKEARENGENNIIDI